MIFGLRQTLVKKGWVICAACAVIVERFGENVLAYIILEGMALGEIYHRALGVRRYRDESPHLRVAIHGMIMGVLRQSTNWRE